MRSKWSFTDLLKQNIKFLNRYGLRSKIRHLLIVLVKPILRWFVVSINANPYIRLKCIAVVKKLGLYNRVRLFSIHLSGYAVRRKIKPLIEMQHLTPRARNIHNMLTVAIGQNKESH